MDTFGKNEKETIKLGAYFCQDKSFNQYFSLSTDGELRRENSCCTVDGGENSVVSIKTCDDKMNQKWTHTKVRYLSFKSTNIKIALFLFVECTISS